MASTTDNAVLDPAAPRWMKVLPPSAAAIYFAYALFRKQDLTASLIIAALIGFVATFPWLSYGHVMPAINGNTSGTSAAGGTNKTSNENISSNASGYPGRQAALSFILNRDTQTTQNLNVNKRKAALNTLTDDEMKVLYVIYRIAQNQAELALKYGKIEGDVLTKKVAMQEFGVDLSKISNVRQTASNAISKVFQYS